MDLTFLVPKDFSHPMQAEPRVLDFLRAKAAAEPGIKALFLFGSRARGDSNPKSDYDVAADAPELSHAAWSRWALEVREGVPTLCGLDLIRLGAEVSSELADKVREEGVLFYERR